MNQKIAEMYYPAKPLIQLLIRRIFYKLKSVSQEQGSKQVFFRLKRINVKTVGVFLSRKVHGKMEENRTDGLLKLYTIVYVFRFTNSFVY